MCLLLFQSLVHQNQLVLQATGGTLHQQTLKQQIINLTRQLEEVKLKHRYGDFFLLHAFVILQLVTSFSQAEGKRVKFGSGGIIFDSCVKAPF